MKKLDEEIFLDAIVHRDTSFDGIFYYGVKTTGIFCKPSCPSRKPKFNSIELFQTIETAKESGYRACLRCHPEDQISTSRTAEIFLNAEKMLSSDCETIKTVQQWSSAVGIPISRLRKIVKEHSGLTLREFLMEKKFDLFKTSIQSGDNVTTSLYNAGFGSSSRLYEKASRRLGMTPGKYKNGGKGEIISYSILDTILGKMLIAATQLGVCSIRFGSDENELLANLKDEFPNADCQQNSEKLSQWVDLLKRYFIGYKEPLDIPLDVHPTAFRAKVWEELRCIPFGETRSYTQVAQAIGQPSAVRAVASACAANPVAIVTPCHRVVHNDGSVSGYRWGVERKKALLESEHKILSKSA